jgi:hypothetical protein
VLLGGTEIVADGEFLTRFWDRVIAVTPEAMQDVAARTFSERNRTVGWYFPDQETAGDTGGGAADTRHAVEGDGHE